MSFTDKLQEMIHNFKEYLARDPYNADQWNSLGMALSKIGDNDEAVKAYLQATKLEPADPVLWYNYGTALDDIGDYSAAIAAYQKALSLAPNDPAIWNNMAISLINLGKISDAVDACQQALQKDPNDANLWDTLGIAFTTIGKYYEARLAFNSALQIDPTNKTYQNALSKIESLSLQRISDEKILKIFGVSAVEQKPFQSSSKKDRKNDDQSEKICEFCGEIVEAAARICPVCGKNLKS